MGYIVLNNAKATLAGAVSIGATSLSVASGKGALFAVGTDYTYITLEDTAGNVDHVKLTARSGDTLTISATTRAFSIGDVVECRPCREAVNDLIASQITAATGKTTPVDADTLGLVDSAASNVLKKLTWANLKATLKTYFDTFYAALAGFTLTGGLIFKAGLNNIASAATVNLTALGANTAHITGTTGISAFTMTSGQVVDLVFDGALLLTHHATNNNLPGGTSFTTQAGDRATYWYDGTTVRCMAYQRVNGSPLYGVLTPAQITADQNDYSPSGITGISMVRVWSDAARNITGLAAWNDHARTIFLHNAGNYAITLKDESASSTAANRFALTADLVLQPDQVALLQYDASSFRWRHVNATPAVTAAITAGTALVKNPVAFSSTTTQAHGLGARPTLFNVALECLTAEQGYSVGDIINYGDGQAGGSNFGLAVLSDATNTTLLISGYLSIMHKTSYIGSSPTAANWKITVTPYKVS